MRRILLNQGMCYQGIPQVKFVRCREFSIVIHEMLCCHYQNSENIKEMSSHFRKSFCQNDKETFKEKLSNNTSGAFFQFHPTFLVSSPANLFGFKCSQKNEVTQAFLFSIPANFFFLRFEYQPTLICFHIQPIFLCFQFECKLFIQFQV